MITHVLDSSAWLAHLLREPGHEEVSLLLLDTQIRVAVSALSLLEVHGRMKQLNVDQRFEEVIDQYRDLFARIIPADETIALRATALRKNAASRIPAIDALIAATAAHHDAVLVHRDPHFLALTGETVRQQAL